MKRIKHKILIPILASVVLLTAASFKNDFFEIAKQIEIFNKMFKEVNMNYVDELNPADLMDTAIKSMLGNLDPYTRFMNEQDVEASRIRYTGDYTGIGAKVRTYKTKLVIVEPYKDYPADKAGLKAGDAITKIDDVLIEDYGDDVSTLLKGAAGSGVEVLYNRQGKSHTTTIKRAAVAIKAVPYYSLIGKEIGYIALQKFNKKASKETRYALRDLKSQGAKKIILDLRGNPGGLLSEAINVVNLFVPKGQLVVTTKSKVKKFNRTYHTKSLPTDAKIPLVILVNGRSASASEIVSGALQDLDRAVIVGNRSFGKGLVQRYKTLSYGTKVKITISRYYTPSGRCIQALDYWHRNEKGEAVRKKQSDYNEFHTRNGRKVFDGGGVLPDVVLGNGKTTPVVKALLKTNSIFDYATNYSYKHPAVDIAKFKLGNADFLTFKKYLKSQKFSFQTNTENTLKKSFEIAKNEALGDATIAGFEKLIKQLNASKLTLLDQSKTTILNLLTDEIVIQKAYREGLYEYYETHDTTIKKASEILNNLAQYENYLK